MYFNKIIPRCSKTTKQITLFGRFYNHTIFLLWFKYCKKCLHFWKLVRTCICVHKSHIYQICVSTCSTCILIMHVTYRCICMIQTGSTLNKNESEYMSMQIFIRQMMKYRYCKVSLNESDFEILTYSWTSISCASRIQWICRHDL